MSAVSESPSATWTHHPYSSVTSELVRFTFPSPLHSKHLAGVARLAFRLCAKIRVRSNVSSLLLLAPQTKNKAKKNDYAHQAAGRFPVSQDYAALLVATAMAVSGENWVTRRRAVVARLCHGNWGQGSEERRGLGPLRSSKHINSAGSCVWGDDPVNLRSILMILPKGRIFIFFYFDSHFQ